MIWLNTLNGLLYTVEGDVVMCKRDGESWRRSSFTTSGCREFLQYSVKQPHFIEQVTSLENK